MAETARQATRATLLALRSGEERVQLNLPVAPMLATARRLVAKLEADGTACHVFVPSAFLTVWNNCDTPGRCSVLGLGCVDQDDGALVIVTPTNRVHRAGAPDELEDEPDGRVLESVQALLVRAWDRPIIMINPDLEALVLSKRPLRPVRPMFMADFFEAYFLATAEAPVTGDTAVVRRAYPGLWELWRAGPPDEKMVLAQRTTGKPFIADLLAAENKLVPPPHIEEDGAPARRLGKQRPPNLQGDDGPFGV